MTSIGPLHAQLVGRSWRWIPKALHSGPTVKGYKCVPCDLNFTWNYLIAVGS